MHTSKTNPQGVHPPVGTYSHSVRVETGEATWIYVSGQVALDAEGNLVAPNDLRGQTEQVFENLTAILEANGATWDDVVKITTFVTTLEDLDDMREVRSRYLPKEPPASTAIQISALVLPDAVIEIDAVAVIAS
ncbi:MAG TPA: RidA family protein [Actinomycetota bacterium]|nr:RidA family protein [Actinomycetota bacterium]